MMAEMEKTAMELKSRGKKPYIIPGGASNTIGATGYALCAEETMNQLNAMQLDIDHIVVPSGSAGTHAGMVVGMTGVNDNIPISGVNVSRPKDVQEEIVYKLAAETAERLEVKGGVERDAVDIPVIYIIDQVTDHIVKYYPEEKRIGILASPAVAMTKLYKRSFEKQGLQDIWPDSENQETLSNIIKAVKRGNLSNSVRETYKQIAQSFIEKDVRIAVVGCTEFSTLDDKLAVIAVDAADILAGRIVAMAKNRSCMRASYTLFLNIKERSNGRF